MQLVLQEDFSPSLPVLSVLPVLLPEPDAILPAVFERFLYIGMKRRIPCHIRFGRFSCKSSDNKNEPEISFRPIFGFRRSPVSRSPFTKTIIHHEVLPKRYSQGEKTQNIDLFFFECSTCCFFAVVGAAALDIHMIRVALVIRVINALIRLAVDTDRPAGMGYGTRKRSHIASVFKAFAAGIILAAGVSARHHDIPLAAAPVAVVGTVFHGTT